MSIERKQLADHYGRVATDLRVSVTDRCNLRCTYCMPEQGLDWLAKDSILTDEEIVRLIAIGVRDLGVTDVRFTGGEPLIRPSIVKLVEQVAQLPQAPRVAMTTNGIGLELVAPSLAEAGLNRINVSLDTLRADRFSALTKRDRLADVLAGLEAAKQAGLNPVKINSVLMRGINEDEAPDLLRFAIANDYQLRFIEQMPLDPMHQWSRENMVPADEILDSLRQHFALTPADDERGAAPAELWNVDGSNHSVGVIASVTQPFCGACDRTRITADGMVRNCLFARREGDLKTLMRAGATDDQIAEAWLNEMSAKAPSHGIDQPNFLQPQRPMSAIGG
ncbi:MAG: GTP 3',8-cyclase MoaA [Candidatus Nanopelagicales bacterium]